MIRIIGQEICLTIGIKSSFFGATNIVKKAIKVSIFIAVMKYHLRRQVHGTLMMTLLEML